MDWRAKGCEATEQPLLHRMDEVALSEMIEWHIDFTDDTGNSVHLNAGFVKHFHQRHDDVLPIVVSIATLPVVLPGGKLYATQGLNRKVGTVFRIPASILDGIPTPQECTPTAAAEALKFLINDWLADVLAAPAGRCILVSALATVIQRVMLPARPAFMVTAPKRGGGKTTALKMAVLAATGVEPSAASWSDNTEERRKALMSYFVSGVPVIIWDNIEMGSKISCSHIEKSITSPTVADRILGETKQQEVASTAIHMFTGNNIVPTGDMGSRTLQVRLEVDRPDPENRSFKHSDPIGWTRNSRGKILRAIYTIMMAEPDVDVEGRANPAAKGRFKEWWSTIGRPIENAAKSLGINLDFGKVLLENEAADEDTQTLVDALEAAAAEWRDKEFSGAMIASLLNDTSNQKSNEAKERAATLRDFLFPDMPVDRSVSARSIGQMLRKYLDTPVPAVDTGILTLTARDDAHAGIKMYKVTRKRR
jgi:hypothetical protein